jgi:hypothetical protein
MPIGLEHSMSENIKALYLNENKMFSNKQLPQLLGKNWSNFLLDWLGAIVP